MIKSCFFPGELLRVFTTAVSLLIAHFHVDNSLGPNGPSLALNFTLIAFYCFLSGILFCVTVAVPQVLRIWESVFALRHFLPCTPLHCVFIKGFPGRWQFFLEESRVFHCSSRHRPSLSVFLNHTVQQFSKIYYSIGSIYVLKPASEHYIKVFRVSNPLFNSFICCQVHVLFTRTQKF